jgi:hypothetical protein
MWKRLKDKWEVYAMIIGILAAGYYAREYIYGIQKSNIEAREAAIRHSNYQDSLFNVKWQKTENMEEKRLQAYEIQHAETNLNLKSLKDDINQYHWGIRRDLREVADTQAEAIRRDSIRRAGAGPVAPIIITR